jgi:hypothetical protein
VGAGPGTGPKVGEGESVGLSLGEGEGLSEGDGEGLSEGDGDLVVGGFVVVVGGGGGGVELGLWVVVVGGGGLVVGLPGVNGSNGGVVPCSITSGRSSGARPAWGGLGARLGGVDEDDSAEGDDEGDAGSVVPTEPTSAVVPVGGDT